MIVNPEVLNCEACPLSKLRKKVVPGMGPVPAKIMVLGEAPGFEEDRTGRPFLETAKAGGKLRPLLNLAGIDRDDVFISNTVRCVPTDDGKEFRDPSAKEKKACRHWLDEEIEAVNPEIILTLGRHAIKSFMPDANISEVHGKAFKIDGRVIVPLYHPSYYNRTSHDNKRIVALDYKNIFKACDSLIAEPSIRWKLLQPKNKKQVEHFCDYLITKPVWAADFETTLLDPFLCRVLGCSFSNGVETYYMDFSLVGDVEALKALTPFFKGEVVLKIIANAKFEAKVLMAKLGDMDPLRNFDDTMLLAYLLQEPGGLKEGVLRNLNVEMTELEDLLGKGKKKRTMEEIPLKDLSKYGAEDSYYTYMLREHYWRRMAENERRIYKEVDLPLVLPLARMEIHGAPGDWDAVEATATPMEEEIGRVQSEIYDLAGGEINLNATADLQNLLFSELGLRSRKRTKKTKQLSTERGVLEGLRDGIVEGKIKKPDPRALDVLNKVLTYKELHKLKSTYLDNLRPHPVTGVIHTEFKQTSTATSRLSSGTGRGGLNFQNIPVRTEIGRLIRKAFIAPMGWLFLKADASQEELRILAHFSQDKRMLQAYRNGEDLHGYTAKEILAHFMPWLDVKDTKHYKILRDTAKCVRLDTLVSVPGTGLVQLGSLSVNRKKNTFSTLNKKVLSVGGSEIAASFFYNGLQETLTLHTAGVTQIITPNHPLLVYKKNTNTIRITSKVETEWVRAEDIRPGDYLVANIQKLEFPKKHITVPFNFWADKSSIGRATYTGFDRNLPSLTITDDWGKFLGYMMGDGSWSSNGQMTYVAGIDDIDVADDFESLVVRLGLPMRRSIRSEEGRKDIIVFQFHSKPLTRLMGRLGYVGESGKTFSVPWFILQSPKSVIINYLNGLYTADGYHTPSGIGLVSKSRELAENVHLLLLSLGIYNRIQVKYNKPYNKDYYEVFIPGRECRKFIKGIGFSSRRKQTRADGAGNKKWVGEYRRVFPIKVLSIEKSGKAEVADVFVPSTNAFTAGGVINHNSLDFGIIYGLQAPGVAALVGCSTGEGAEIIHEIYKLYPGIKKYEHDTEEMLAKNGYVTDIIGRKMYLVDYFSKDKREKEEALKLARNYRIQSSGGTIIRLATKKVDDYILSHNLESYLHLQVHDELDAIVRPWEVHELASVISKALAPDILSIPMETEIQIGRNWVDLANYNTEEDYIEYEASIR